MSFSSGVKNELARIETDEKCCMLSETAGFIRMCGTIMLLGNGQLGLRLTTENAAIARLFMKRIKSYFGAGAKLQVAQNTLTKKRHIYELIIDKGSEAERILREIGILCVEEGCSYFTDNISKDIIESKCCKKAYLRGAFMGSGTISNPEKGYHLELVCNNLQLANDLRDLINSFSLKSKVVSRKRNYIVYLKEGEQISDFLALLGAHNHVFEFENVRIIKELRNKTNRIVNCENANLNKSINNAMRQIADIRLIDHMQGIDTLPEKLREAARLRLENPEASLGQIAEMTNPPLKKSGINHRFKKISEIAEKYKEKDLG